MSLGFGASVPTGASCAKAGIAVEDRNKPDPTSRSQYFCIRVTFATKRPLHSKSSEDNAPCALPTPFDRARATTEHCSGPPIRLIGKLFRVVIGRTSIKDIILLNISFAAALPNDSVIVLPVPKAGVAAAGSTGLSEKALRLLRAGASASRFEGEAGSVFSSFVGEPAQRVVQVGIGQGAEEDYEKAGAAISATLQTSGAKGAAIDLSGLALAPTAISTARLALGAVLRNWRYDAYRTKLKDAQKISLSSLAIIGAPSGTEAEWAKAEAIAKGVMLTRELVTEPANIIYPESFVERCKPLAGLGIKINVLGKAEMAALGMGSLLGVNQGSVREPQLLVMHWDGTGGSVEKPVVFVGKGVTFDTGGISIKPAAGMEDMKWDMGGAGAVAGAMMALAGRKAKANVVGICGLVENMPDGNAQRPGDVVTSMSGQTIEVINTDAEGRLVLCDAITWAQQEFKPEVLVDLATLTGAIIISLGNEYAGLFSNDDGLSEQLTAAGKAVGDPLWRQPIGAAYDKLIDSPIADMKNVGPREGGSITAAQFIKRFVDDGVKWAHLDIAGMVWASKPGGTWDKGATGYGVRLIDRFVADQFEK
jgi:leucyl aminopeptidase